MARRPEKITDQQYDHVFSSTLTLEIQSSIHPGGVTSNRQITRVSASVLTPSVQQPPIQNNNLPGRTSSLPRTHNEGTAASDSPSHPSIQTTHINLVYQNVLPSQLRFIPFPTVPGTYTYTQTGNHLVSYQGPISAPMLGSTSISFADTFDSEEVKFLLIELESNAQGKNNVERCLKIGSVGSESVYLLIRVLTSTSGSLELNYQSFCSQLGKTLVIANIETHPIATVDSSINERIKTKMIKICEAGNYKLIWLDAPAVRQSSF